MNEQKITKQLATMEFRDPISLLSLAKFYPLISERLEHIKDIVTRLGSSSEPRTEVSCAVIPATM